MRSIEKPLKFEYTNTILNFASSLMKYYNVKPAYPTNKLVDQILSNGYKHVAVILLDGMGIEILKNNVPHASIFINKRAQKMNSVFPPTTAASTTSFITGKAPIEHGWLGWHEYLDEENPSIELFKNTEYVTGNPFTKYQVKDKIPVTPWWGKIKKAKPSTIMPNFGDGQGFDSFKEQIEELLKTFSTPDPTFTYLYWTYPDHLIHEAGADSKEVKDELAKLEEPVRYLNEQIPEDSICFIIADHGLVDVEYYNLYDYPTFYNTLSKTPAGESRCMTFYVKEDQRKTFEEEFEKNFGKDFVLYTKEEFLNAHLMGNGPVHPTTLYSLGDYVAVGTSNYSFNFIKPVEGDIILRSHHAGFTQAELEIPLIVLKK